MNEILSNREVESDENKIDQILESMIEAHESKGSRVYILNYGSKSLEVFIDFMTNEVMTFVENIDSKRKAGETTLLYTAVKKVIENTVDETGKKLDYSLRTTFENMKNWAETKGRKIFDWDEEDQEIVDRKTYYTFKKAFKPKKQKLAA